MKNMINKRWILAIVILFTTFSCEYLDVVPEGVSRLENAFSMRNQTEKYLYTCYSYMPKDGDPSQDPAILGGDEIWTIPESSNIMFDYGIFKIANGLQSATNPLGDKWDGLYKGIRDCNIFLESASSVPDLDTWERDQWIAEVKFLKAYYHYYLLRMYGPIPVIRENLPIDVSIDKVRVYREPVDTCVNYITRLLDEAIKVLPLNVRSNMSEQGRITKPIAMALKAKVLVMAASPLFNGNKDQVTLVDKNGISLFSKEYDAKKWVIAVEACKEAVDICVNELGLSLYNYPGSPQHQLSDTIRMELTLRNSFSERWNSDIIWANTQSGSNSIQTFSAPKLDITYTDGSLIRQLLGAPLKMADLFYTENGVPVNEDKVWSNADKYKLRKAQEADKLYIKQGEQTVGLHYDREARFYAFLGFDTGIWYGAGKYDDKKPLYSLACRKGRENGKRETMSGPITAYFLKKCIYFENAEVGIVSYSSQNYPWPLIRLSDLFLLYAEALNESVDSEANRLKAREYIDLVRKRAGLKSVAESWENYSMNTNKYKSQQGLRQIIQQERMIELCFEGQRFWDIRRWKTAVDLYQTPIQGWDLEQGEAAYFYRTKLLFKQEFGVKDYFWPIRSYNITINPNLIQNIGW